MDLRQKLEFQEVIDNYLADQGIYEIFEDCVADLMVDKPEDPIEYLIKKFSKDSNRRVVIIGSSSRVRKEVAKEIAGRFHMELISVGDLLKEEVDRNGKNAGKILASWKAGTYVKDSIVLDIVLPIIEQHESHKSSYVLEGLPRTRSQAIALQRSAVIPDRVILLNSYGDTYRTDFIDNFAQFAQSDADIVSIADMAYQEYELGLKGVIEEYSWQIHEISAEDDANIAAEMAFKVLLMKGRGLKAKKPPKVLIIGGPLSGKTTQAAKVAKKYGLTLVKVAEVIEKAIQNRTDIGKVLNDYVRSGTKIPDKLIIEVMRERLDSIDCRMNGWVIDGFPNTYEQCRALRYLKQYPSSVFFLEASDTLVYDRAKYRRVDPKNGKIYGRESIEDTALVAMPEDDEEAVKERMQEWREETIKIHAEFSKIGKSIKAEIVDSLILDSISDSIEALIPNELASS